MFDEAEFEWDKGNREKNKKHDVENNEAEEAFFDKHAKIFSDPIHSTIEKRYILLGKTKKKRLLFIVFTKRKNKIRIVSARNINKKKEVQFYEEKT